MSGGSIVPIIAGTIAATAAAAAAKKKRQEEEKRASYTPEDLNGWEFKIVRANTRKFRSSEMVEKVRQEEARAGWQLVEKFDDYRLRFKRRIEKRSMDTHLAQDIDPYRTSLASGIGSILGILFIIFVVLTGVVIALGARFGFEDGIIGGLTLTGLIAILLVLFLFVAIVVIVRKNIGS
jgi:hypothetical protein